MLEARDLFTIWQKTGAAIVLIVASLPFMLLLKNGNPIGCGQLS